MYKRDIEHLMGIALHAARESRDDIPVGAVIYDSDNVVVAVSSNTAHVVSRVSQHAEISAIEQVSTKLGSLNLAGYGMVTTLEPCAMCAAAISFSGISPVIFGAYNHKSGAAGSVLDILRDSRIGINVEVVGGIRCAESEAILSRWFSALRGEVTGPRVS